MKLQASQALTIQVKQKTILKENNINKGENSFILKKKMAKLTIIVFFTLAVAFIVFIGIAGAPQSLVKF